MFNYVIFVLPVIVSILNLIDVQYLQNVVFSSEMGQNQSSSDTHHSWRKSFFSDNIEWGSKNLRKMMSADVKTS